MGIDPRQPAAYPEGVRWDVPIASTPAWAILDEAAQRWPDRPALHFLGRTISFRELAGLVDRMAKGLQSIGVRPGSHVGLYLPNCPQYVIAFFGALKAGAVIVNYSPLDAPATLTHKIADSETDFLVCLDLPMLYPVAQALLAQTRLTTLIVSAITDYSGAPAPPVPAPAARDGGKREVRFTSLVDNDGGHSPVDIGDPGSALAVIQYTGGTTGVPKGAALSHANLVAAAEIVTETARNGAGALEFGHERLLLVLPLFHIYAELMLLLAIKLGAESILHPKFDIDAVVRDLAGKKITVMCGVPTMYVAIFAKLADAEFDLSSLKHSICGGAPLPVEMIEPFQALTGAPITDGWGMSETTAAGTFTPRHGPRKHGSCGLALPRVEFKVVGVEDPSKTLPSGEKGEICLRGPNVMEGYWKGEASAPIKTADGYFRTGDVGYIDADGFIFIIDRCKDMLLCGGYNVYPRIIEEAIYAHPDVAEVIVIGVPDEYRGQSPKAFVRMKDGAVPLTLQALQAFLVGRVGKHEMVKALEVRAELPKTAVGKLSKRALQEEEAARR